jgi:hypothetical protein
MAGKDSSEITSALARLASAVSANGDSAFRGLPFSVRKAYRFSLGGTSVVVGNVIRRINEEANPRVEHLLLVAERANSGEDYKVAFQNRSAGSEDEVRTNGILAAVQFVQTRRPALVITFESDNGGQVALLERLRSNTWGITWRSAYTGC